MADRGALMSVGGPFAYYLDDPNRFGRAAYRPPWYWPVMPCPPPPEPDRAMPRVRGKPRRSLLDIPRAYPMVRAAVDHLTGVLADHVLILAIHTDVLTPENPWP